jgi:hypothetical protein
MGKTSILFMVSLCTAAGVTLAAGCGSSSNKAAPVVVDGGEDSGDDGSTGPASCIPTGGSLCTPAVGITCCFDTSALSGTCEQATACTTPITIGCLVQTDCTGSLICCGGLGGDAGALLAAIADAGDASLGDASLASLASGGAASALAGISANTACQSACTGTQYHLCTSSSECTAPEVCAAPSAAAGAGALGAASSLITIKVCQVPVEAGASDAGSTSDAGTVSDAGSTSDGNVADAPTGG